MWFLTGLGVLGFIYYLVLSIVVASLLYIYMGIYLIAKHIDLEDVVRALKYMGCVLFCVIFMCIWLGLQLWIIAIKSGCIGYCICTLAWMIRAIFFILIMLYACYSALEFVRALYETQLETRVNILIVIHFFQIMIYIMIFFIFITWFFLAVILGFGF